MTRLKNSEASQTNNKIEAGLTVDTNSGIPAEEQREIIANIDAIAGGTRIIELPSKIAAKKRGVLFPLLVNIAAVFLLAGGLFFLWRIFKEDDTTIRLGGGTLDSTEGHLIEEMRSDFDAAQEEIARLNDNQKKAAAYEWQISGFYKTVNSQFNAGKLEQARETLRTMREFMDFPAFAGIIQIEQRREINMAILDAMTRLIDESIRNSRVTEELDAASIIAENAVKEKDAALERTQSLITELENVRDTSEKRAAVIAERDRTVTELRTQNTDLRRSITDNEQRINTLTAQNDNLSQRLNAVQQALSPTTE